MSYHTLEFQGGQLRFAAGHFTIFSATHREHMHGHNYLVAATLTASCQEPGITFDYALFREKLQLYCQQLSQKFLLPTQSPYLKLTEDENYYLANFAGKTLYFLKEDVLLMPLTNITIEQLSLWFVDQILLDQDFIQKQHIISFEIRVFNGPEQGAKASWQKKS